MYQVHRDIVVVVVLCRNLGLGDGTQDIVRIERVVDGGNL